ncbi:MAG: hypothetical protein AAGC73_03720 [Verrucomicrobiota bacterium]
MSDNSNIVRYLFDLGDEVIHFEINTALSEQATPNKADETAPDWARLEKNQCKCCPLKAEDSKYCPTALRVHQVLERFKSHASVQQVNLTVQTQRRTYVQKCDMQNGLNSMLGLQMATGGCPILGRLRSMATFHMPFCSFGETLYRSVGAYLIQQFFILKDGGEPDWELERLREFYQELEGLNKDFTERIKNIEQSDAITNAIVIFFASSIVVHFSIEEELKEYRDYFTGKSVTPPKGGH